MPVAAIGAAIYSGVQIATTTLTAFEMISAVGAIASGIGALTGNEDLMKIGGVAALAGGVGSFASGSNWFGLNPAEGGSIEAAKNMAAPGVESVTPTVDAGSTAAALRDSANAAPAATSGLETTAAQNTIDAAIGSPSPALIDTAPSVTAPQQTASSLMDAADTTNQNAGFSIKNNLRPYGSPPVKSNSILDSLKNFADIFKDKNGNYNKDLLAMAGNFVGGMFDEKKGAETDYLKTRNTQLNNQMRNANAIPDMSGFKFTPRDIFPKTTPSYSGTRVGLIGA